ncbi:MAG: PilZ domain-containing protein [Candidatus Calescibacterium sp.]|nr:PilZ domain-containing protein [Candidatus Calescibacterium sp.]MCX7733390.1 PilZ domain-containing protein [bacterium]MDW8087468.1 PilZ domain-containing protein [Candidatus Calescibacterium sp.]
MIETFPKGLFNLRISGSGVINLIQEFKDNIFEVSILNKKFKGAIRGYIIGLKDESKIVVRSDEKLKKNEKYEIRFVSGRGIVLINTKVDEIVIGIQPNIYVFEKPSEILVCERRRYYRVKPKQEADLVIKRENGYALSGDLGDVSLGGFSMKIQMKDKMIEYFLPMIDEEVRFSLDFPRGKSKIKIDGSAALKHYTVDSKGFYRGGFSFTKVDKSKVKKLLDILQSKR